LYKEGLDHSKDKGTSGSLLCIMYCVIFFWYLNFLKFMCCSHFVVNALTNFLKCLFVVGFNAGLVAYQAWIDTIKLLAVSLLS